MSSIDLEDRLGSLVCGVWKQVDVSGRNVYLRGTRRSAIARQDEDDPARTRFIDEVCSKHRVRPA